MSPTGLEALEFIKSCSKPAQEDLFSQCSFCPEVRQFLNQMCIFGTFLKNKNKTKINNLEFIFIYVFL